MDLVAGVFGAVPLSLWVVLGALVMLMLASPYLNALAPTKPKAPPRPFTFPYAPRASLFTPAELAFLHALKAAAPAYDVHGKVRLEDVIEAKTGLSASERQRARGFIKSRHIDFVLCLPESGRIVCAIELDDPSHDTLERQRTDDLKTRALAAAQVPLVRLRTARRYDPEALRGLLEAALGIPGPKSGLAANSNS